MRLGLPGLSARARRALAVGALFVALTVVMTWPQVPRVASAVRDIGDPLLNTWILSWDAHELARLDVAGFFDANIFYPYQRTLAFSEHLFPQSLVAAPVLWLSGNPILAYNVVLLLGFLTSALGMYAFARYLTGSTYGATLAGLVFAFNPFMFDHLSHVQILTAGGIPLTFLFLERFLVERRWSDVLLFALVFTAQILANGYYALFLSLFVGIFLTVELVRRRLLLRPDAWAKLAVAGLLVVAVSAPFFRQYLLMQREMGFSRGIGSHAVLASYVTAPSINRLYGPLAPRRGGDEARLLPGGVAVVVAALGLTLALRRRRRAGGDGGSTARRIVRRALDALIVVAAGFVVLLTVAGPLDLAPVLRANHVERPLLLLALAVALRLAVFRRRTVTAGQGGEPVGPSPALYAILGALAFLFSFGTGGPYELLYRHVPGFDGIRAVARFHIMVMLVVALLAAYGAATMAAARRRMVRLALTAVAPLLILAEYASFPLPLATVPVKDEIAPVYRWLAEHGDESTAVLELPLPAPGKSSFAVECPRVYASTYHWHRLVNGFSGFSPPLYRELRRRWEDDPVGANLADARTLGVRYIVVHLHEYRPALAAALAARLAMATEEVNLVERSEDARVFEVEGWSRGFERKREVVGSPLPRDGWKASASVNDGAAALAIDGSTATRWDTGGPQVPGTSFAVDLGRERSVSGVRLRLGPSRHDFPRGYRVDLSRNGTTWATMAMNESARLPIQSYLHPSEAAAVIGFPPHAARFVRITNLAASPTYYWSITELDVLGGP